MEEAARVAQAEAERQKALQERIQQQYRERVEGEDRWRRNEQAFSLAREVHEYLRMQVDDARFEVTKQSSPSEVQMTRVAELEAALRENEAEKNAHGAVLEAEVACRREDAKDAQDLLEERGRELASRSETVRRLQAEIE